MSKEGRAHYKIDEDEALVRFVVNNESVYKASGDKIWRLAESLHITNHSWQSMQNRYKKNLKPRWSSLLWKFGINSQDTPNRRASQSAGDDPVEENRPGRVGRQLSQDNVEPVSSTRSKHHSTRSKRPRVRLRTSTEPASLPGRHSDNSAHSSSVDDPHHGSDSPVDTCHELGPLCAKYAAQEHSRLYLMNSFELLWKRT